MFPFLENPSLPYGQPLLCFMCVLPCVCVPVHACCSLLYVYFKLNRWMCPGPASSSCPLFTQPHPVRVLPARCCVSMQFAAPNCMAAPTVCFLHDPPLSLGCLGRCGGGPGQWMTPVISLGEAWVHGHRLPRSRQPSDVLRTPSQLPHSRQLSDVTHAVTHPNTE